jgi:hypothetical protein
MPQKQQSALDETPERRVCRVISTVRKRKVDSIMPYRKGKSQTPLGAIAHAHNDRARPSDICPACGRAYDEARIAAPFHPPTSAALDWVEVLQQDLLSLKQTLEEVLL